MDNNTQLDSHGGLEEVKPASLPAQPIPPQSVPPAVSRLYGRRVVVSKVDKGVYRLRPVGKNVSYEEIVKRAQNLVLADVQFASTGPDKYGFEYGFGCSVAAIGFLVDFGDEELDSSVRSLYFSGHNFYDVGSDKEVRGVRLLALPEDGEIKYLG